jgi:NAD-reducing hydrogenase small subunit
MSEKPKLATLWLDGCSGCHMSFLDLDEIVLELLDKVDLVYSPLVDNKSFPEMVDITLVEGAVSTEEDLEKMRHIRQHTKILVSLGDCAVIGSIPAMRNRFALREVLLRVYPNKVSPSESLPILLDSVRPLHTVVHVDFNVPGCPPSAKLIYYVISELLANRIPDLSHRAHYG